MCVISTILIPALMKRLPKLQSLYLNITVQSQKSPTATERTILTRPY